MLLFLVEFSSAGQAVPAWSNNSPSSGEIIHVSCYPNLRAAFIRLYVIAEGSAVAAGDYDVKALPTYVSGREENKSRRVCSFGANDEIGFLGYVNGRKSSEDSVFASVNGLVYPTLYFSWHPAASIVMGSPPIYEVCVITHGELRDPCSGAMNVNSHAGVKIPPPSAGFDCGKAVTTLEKFICARPALSVADFQMTQAYRKAIAASRVGRSVIEEQKYWLRQRSRLCDPPEKERSPDGQVYLDTLYAAIECLLEDYEL